MAVPTLTRRRSGNPHQETWHVYFGDVRVGVISRAAGVPMHSEQWIWDCGFYPGMEPGAQKSGGTKSFEAAREAFEIAWSKLLPTLPESAFDEWRRDRDYRADLRARRDRGERLPSEIPTSMMRCVCGAMFDSHKPDESYSHRGHIYEAQRKQGRHR